MSNTTSFKIYTNSGLTTLFSGLQQVVNKTDLSDNPQDFGPFYFGSNATGTKLQTTTSPGTGQITITPTDIATVWVASTAYSLGQLIEPTTPNGKTYIVTTAGTSGGTQPTWPTSVTSTVSDGSVVWQCYAATHPTTEIKLATTSGSGLTSATAGAALNLGTIINSGVANAVVFYMRVTNTVTSVNNNVGYPQLGININSCTES